MDEPSPKVLARDPVALTAALVRRPSVTPEEGGAIALVAEALGAYGFETTRVDRGGVANLFARWGGDGPVLAFAGHTDVVPPGDPAAWTRPPFSGAQAEGRLWGRGAVDMKSGVAAFVSAACGFIADGAGPPAGGGAIALLITGDEEGPAEDGTRALLDWMGATGARMDVCLVGEPTSRARFGDTVKIGRRGSLHIRLEATGVPGHVAYPAQLANPVPPLIHLLDRLTRETLDAGTAHFEPSSLQISTVDVGNPTVNMTPARAVAALNIRYNDARPPEELIAWIEAEAAAAEAPGVTIAVTPRISARAFVTEPGPWTDLVCDAVADVVGTAPAMETGGGTSDARFISAHCPVVEFGLRGDTMHQVDERVEIEDIPRLAAVYRRALERFFRAP